MATAIPSQSGYDAIDRHFLSLAIEQARRCHPVDTGYNVGAVLVQPQRTTDSLTVEELAILTTGYSRELAGNTHAEECCLVKLNDTNRATGASRANVDSEPIETSTTSGPGVASTSGLWLYTTMEPCSTRLSGKASCAARLIESQMIARVIVGAREPSTFVAECQGIQLLHEAGIAVAEIAEMAAECLAMNQHLLPA